MSFLLLYLVIIFADSLLDFPFNLFKRGAVYHETLVFFTFPVTQGYGYRFWSFCRYHVNNFVNKA